MSYRDSNRDYPREPSRDFNRDSRYYKDSSREPYPESRDSRRHSREDRRPRDYGSSDRYSSGREGRDYSSSAPRYSERERDFSSSRYEKKSSEREPRGSSSSKRKRYSDESDDRDNRDRYEPSVKKTRQAQPTVISIKEDDAKVEITNFRVSTRSAEALARDGITTLFPIQVNTFDYAFDGRDIIGRARTGTGKTLSFSLPVIEKLIASGHRGRNPAVICLAPTRELAKQVEKVMKQVSDRRLSTLCIYGGTPYHKQNDALARGVDIVVGTPGRVLDLIDKRSLVLSDIKYFILDEADEMLNMGFLKDIEKIFNHIGGRTCQTLLYSATMPDWVRNIAEQYLSQDYIIIDLVGDGREQKTAEGIEHYTYNAPYQNYAFRLKILDEVIKEYSEGGKVMVFCDTKSNCKKLSAQFLIKELGGNILHGGIPQNQRERTLRSFRDGQFRVLVCTDVAARGLDIDDIKLVVQFYPPRDTETYVHRCGRTGRAGNTGVCVTFFDSSAKNENRNIYKIEQYAKIRFKPALEGVNIDVRDLPQVNNDFNSGYGGRDGGYGDSYGRGNRGGYGDNRGYNNGGGYRNNYNSRGGYDNNRREPYRNDRYGGNDNQGSYDPRFGSGTERYGGSNYSSNYTEDSRSRPPPPPPSYSAPPSHYNSNSGSNYTGYSGY